MSSASYKTYRNMSRQNISGPEAIALLLGEASRCLQEAQVAIQENAIEPLYKACERAVLILGNLEKDLPVLENEEAKAIEELRAYYNDTITLILRMNRKKDLRCAETLTSALSELATSFREMAWRDEAAARESSQEAKSFATMA